MKKFAALICTGALLALIACSPEQPQALEKGPNSEARSTAFKKMMPDFSTMSKIVKGDQAYDVEKFEQAAASFAVLSQEPFKHFVSDGAGRDGDALPAIWTETAKFHAEEERFHNAVAALNKAARTGNLDTIKAAFNNVGASCKACHDSFRRPK